MRIAASALAASALAVLPVLGGCTADEAPSSLPPLPSASPAPSAMKASPLPVPAAARAATPQGASAFARHFLEVVNHGFATNESSAVRSLSDPGCDACNNLVRAIERPMPEGEIVRGGDYEVVFAESPPVADGDVVVDLRYELSEVRVTADDGRVLRTTPRTAAVDAQMRLVRRGSSWVVRGFRNVKP